MYGSVTDELVYTNKHHLKIEKKGKCWCIFQKHVDEFLRAYRKVNFWSDFRRICLNSRKLVKL